MLRAFPIRRALLQRARYSTAPSSSAVAEAVKEAQVPTPAPSSSDVVAADVVSGAPVQLRHRQVRIYKPTRNTMQSGGAKGENWRIDFDTMSGSGRWENPLMGWASSGDYMQGTRISFKSKEAAITFAEKQGWDYYLQGDTIKRIPPKNYAENYVYKPNTLRIARTK